MTTIFFFNTLESQISLVSLATSCKERKENIAYICIYIPITLFVYNTGNHKRISTKFACNAALQVLCWKIAAACSVDTHKQGNTKRVTASKPIDACLSFCRLSVCMSNSMSVRIAQCLNNCLQVSAPRWLLVCLTTGCSASTTLIYACARRIYLYIELLSQAIFKCTHTHTHT